MQLPWLQRQHVVNDSLAQQKLLSSIADNTSLQHHPQNVELMSILQGLPERSMAGVNNGTGGWSNFPVQGGLDPLQDKLDMQHGQNFPAQAAFRDPAPEATAAESPLNKFASPIY
ncbi:GYF domain-containing protein [Abeliophyllum distichum]|uniref:GYF domain-containing protein n=1 Tax=Abeliophyllum distichum TaxID=126358 RepID=A0ABD1SC89_9LAMI